MNVFGYFYISLKFYLYLEGYVVLWVGGAFDIKLNSFLISHCIKLIGREDYPVIDKLLERITL